MVMAFRFLIVAILMIAVPAQRKTPAAGNTKVFLLFGQSNMWGVPHPEQQDLEINPRIEVLTLTSCAKHGANQWVPAQPPLHGCVGQPGDDPRGPGLGPGDYFARTLADAFPQDSILLVPAAVPGVSIDTFQPGQPNYNTLLTRAKMAQQRGPITGMIFHQGESDNGQSSWPNRVKAVVDRLRVDLGAGNVPFVAGELPYRPAGCCGGHNTYVNMLPNVITNAAIAKADGLTLLSTDGFGNLHFDAASQRTLGRRYGEAMLKLLGK
jgi:Carbohydrate esterase, sialic acid-specific acetylesterase